MHSVDCLSKSWNMIFLTVYQNWGRFRINAFYQSGSVAIAIRRIPFEVPTPQALGVPRIA